MTSEKILLETTIQLYRTAHDFTTKERYSEEIREKEVWTTSLVFREFLRTVIQDIAFAYAAAEQLEATSDARVALTHLSDALARHPNYSQRSAQRLHLVMSAILREFSTTTVSRKRLLRTLKRIGDQWIWDFFHVVQQDGAEREIGCLTGLDKNYQELENMKQGFPFPPAPDFPLGAVPFLEAHKTEVRQVERNMTQSTLRAGRDEALLRILNRMKDASGEYQFSEKLRSNTQGNWCLGDLLIALEMPSETILYTSDRHYQAICPALGKRYHRVTLSQSKEK